MKNIEATINTVLEAFRLFTLFSLIETLSWLTAVFNFLYMRTFSSLYELSPSPFYLTGFSH